MQTFYNEKLSVFTLIVKNVIRLHVWLYFCRKKSLKILFTISSKRFRPALWHTQSPIQWMLGAVYPGVKRQGLEVDHSHPSSAE
jgi:hypothetical protein